MKINRRTWMKAAAAAIATSMIGSGSPPSEVEEFWKGAYPGVTFEIQYLPLPIVHKDFFFSTNIMRVPRT